MNTKFFKVAAFYAFAELVYLDELQNFSSILRSLYAPELQNFLLCR